MSITFSSGPRYYSLGKDLLSLNIYSGIRAADGTVAWTLVGGMDKNGTIGGADYIKITDARMLDMIAAVDDNYANYERTLYDASLSIGEILKRGQNALPYVLNNFDLVLVSFTRTCSGSAGATIAWQTGGTGSALSITYPANTCLYIFSGNIAGGSDGVVAFGKNACEIDLKPKNLLAVGGGNGAAYGPLTYFNT